MSSRRNSAAPHDLPHGNPDLSSRISSELVPSHQRTLSPGGYNPHHRETSSGDVIIQFTAEERKELESHASNPLVDALWDQPNTILHRMKAEKHSGAILTGFYSKLAKIEETYSAALSDLSFSYLSSPAHDLHEGKSLMTGWKALLKMLAQKAAAAKHLAHLIEAQIQTKALVASDHVMAHPSKKLESDLQTAQRALHKEDDHLQKHKAKYFSFKDQEIVKLVKKERVPQSSRSSLFATDEAVWKSFLSPKKAKDAASNFDSYQRAITNEQAARGKYHHTILQLITTFERLENERVAPLMASVAAITDKMAQCASETYKQSLTSNRTVKLMDGPKDLNDWAAPLASATKPPWLQGGIQPLPNPNADASPAQSFTINLPDAAKPKPMLKWQQTKSRLLTDAEMEASRLDKDKDSPNKGNVASRKRSSISRRRSSVDRQAAAAAAVAAAATAAAPPANQEPLPASEEGKKEGEGEDEGNPFAERKPSASERKPSTSQAAGDDNNEGEDDHVKGARPSGSALGGGGGGAGGGAGGGINDLKSTIVIDNGSGFVKAGFSGMSAPLLVVPSMICNTLPPAKGPGVDRGDRQFVGSHGHHLASGFTEDNKEISFNGNVFSDDANWDDVESMWEYLFVTLGCDPAEHHVLLTKPLLAPVKYHDKLAEILVERFEVPAHYVALSPLLGAYAYGCSTGLVVDIGESSAQILPLVDGYSLTNHERRVKHLGGKRDTLRILDYLKKSGAAEMLDPRIYPCGVHLQLTARLLKERLAFCAHSFLLYQDECQVLKDTEGFLGGGDPADGTTTSLNVNSLALQQEMAGLGEVLFTPRDILQDEDSSILSIPELVKGVVMECDLDTRKQLAGNIFLTGGVTTMRGFDARFTASAKEAFSNIVIPRVYTSERRYGSWVGGSVLSAMELFNDSWLSKNEYLDGKRQE